MNFTIPIYVEEHAVEKESSFVVRPLFFPEPLRRGPKLTRVLSRLGSDIRQHLLGLGRQPRQDTLLPWVDPPEVAEFWLDVRLEARRGSARVGLLVVAYEALNRRLAFTPALPDIVFEVSRGQDLRERAIEVLSRHFRDLEARDAAAPMPGDLFKARRAWITRVEHSVSLPDAFELKKREPFALLGGPGVLSGAEELERVGRCLNHLFPDELERAVLREGEVEELSRLLGHADRRPVLLLGPRQAGKTSVIHEWLYRGLSLAAAGRTRPRQVWLLAPSRLISGMSYVGQWEQRLIAILEEARNREHVLYFDDLVGLSLAGVTRDSSLSVAHILKSWIERREVRVLAEITPEAFRLLEERDRRFADLFHIVRVGETGEAETFRALLAVQRRLEELHGCRFDLDASPVVIDLHRRHVRGAAFPGKAAGFLRQVALKFRGRGIGREQVVAEFQQRSGLSLVFLDGRKRLGRDEILAALREQIAGQEHALAAVADVISLARARLNDPGRPLASLLFLGPTGVGKTQTAKAVAAFLFGGADRLLRFDMNEFVSSDAVGRLIGTLTEPEGLLTSAARRQPFCVLLLDEIEKAHPDVFDVLLSVLGEGRLTDALGRTSDFSSSLIILTSNLGAHEMRHRLGYVPSADEGAQYQEAARRFFRPEFFNRLDRIVAFRPLGRVEVESIARRHLDDVLQRDGLRQRRCLVQLLPGVMERLVEHGFHPQLGARALKRVIERQIAQPLARHLAGLALEDLAVISIFCRQDALAVEVDPVRRAAPASPPEWAKPPKNETVFDRLHAAVDRLRGELAGHEPPGPVAFDAIAPDDARYFAAREQLRRVDAVLRKAEPRPRPGSAPRGSGLRPRLSRRRHGLIRFTSRGPYKMAQANDAFRAGLADVASVGPAEAEPWSSTEEAAGELALLELMLRGPALSRVAFVVSLLPGGPFVWPTWWLDAHEEFFGRIWGYRCDKANLPPDTLAPERVGLQAWIVTGPGADVLLGTAAGMHLFERPDQGPMLVQALALPLSGDEGPGQALQRLREKQRAWSDRLLRGETAEAPPLAPGKLLSVFLDDSHMSDLRSGLELQERFAATHLRALILARLPLPVELTALWHG